MRDSRRKFLRLLAAAVASMPLSSIWADKISSLPGQSLEGNFGFVYKDDQLRGAFLDFLTNVFHLYPEERLHGLIELISQKKIEDRAIYVELQRRLPEVAPFLSELRYALPALNKQKKIMAAQTQSLLADKDQYEGYLEIGTTGRYLDALEEVRVIHGERFFIAEKPASYSLMDIVDRGQMTKAGQFIALNDYSPDIHRYIPPNTLELVTVYIGFHHCPLNLREAFLADIHAAMKPGASLIIRDHDVSDDNSRHLVGLAHDVFNMGTYETWAYNENELRHFYSLAFLDELLQKSGFKSNGKRLYQAGDPTLNALMLYTRL